MPVDVKNKTYKIIYGKLQFTVTQNCLSGLHHDIFGFTGSICCLSRNLLNLIPWCYCLWQPLWLAWHMRQETIINSLWRSDAVWRQRSGSTLAQVMACCLTSPSHYLNQCWLTASTDQWRLSKGNFTRDNPSHQSQIPASICLDKISFKSPRDQWVNDIISTSRHLILQWHHMNIKAFLILLLVQKLIQLQQRNHQSTTLLVLCAGNPLISNGFPVQRASNQENVFMSWYHHVVAIHPQMPLIARFMGPTWGPSGADRTQVGPMLAPWTLLSGASLFTSNTFNSSPPGQNGHHFTNNNCRCIFVKENFCSLIKIAQKFVPKGPVDYNPALIKIMAWRWIGDKPLSEPMLTWFTETYMRQLKHICATVEVWVWIRNFISHFPWYVVTYPCWDQWLWGPSHHWFFLRKFSFSCNSILVSLSFNELITTNFCS